MIWKITDAIASLAGETKRPCSMGARTERAQKIESEKLACGGHSLHATDIGAVATGA